MIGRLGITKTVLRSRDDQRVWRSRAPDTSNYCDRAALHSARRRPPPQQPHPPTIAP